MRNTGSRRPPPAAAGSWKLGRLPGTERERVERAGGWSEDDGARGCRYDRRSAEVWLVPEQELNRPEVGAGFEQVRSEERRQGCGWTGLSTPARRAACSQARQTTLSLIGCSVLVYQRPLGNCHTRLKGES